MKKIILLILSFFLLNVDLMAGYIATVTASIGKVDVIRSTNTIPVSVGLKLEESDILITGKNSKTQIIFQDETIVSIGRNTSFSIQEYLFEDGSAPVARFGMLQGAMKVITGKIGKIAPQKFAVVTKTSTIGIRGTNFTVAVNEIGNLEAYCTFGEISIKVDDSMYAVKQGLFIAISSDKTIEIKEFSAEDLKEMRKEKFAKSTPKKSLTQTQETKVTQNKIENTQQLNVTINDVTNVTLQNLDEKSIDTIVNSKTLDATIANYSMNDALYYGNYSVLENTTTSFSNKGDVKLSIDFAQDTATLELGSFLNPEPDVTFDFEHVNTNTVQGNRLDGDGSATILFNGPTGNQVNGAFSINENVNQSAKGVYSAKSFQELH